MELERAMQFISAHRYAVGIILFLIIVLLFEGDTGQIHESTKTLMAGLSVSLEGMSDSFVGFIENIGCFGVFVIATLVYFLAKSNSGKQKKNEQKHETRVLVKCTKCKALNEEDAEFCKKCGEKL